MSSFLKKNPWAAGIVVVLLLAALVWETNPLGGTKQEVRFASSDSETAADANGEATTTTTTAQANECKANGPTNVTQAVTTVSRADSPEGKALPDLVAPDPSRAPKFPDVPQSGHPALVAYESPFEDGDYFEDCHGDIDVPQFYFRVMTAGVIDIPQLDVHCQSTESKGCAAIVVNWFGRTVMYRNTQVDNGFTVAGRVWNMGKPEQVTTAGQALLDHYMGRMTQGDNDSNQGANCAVVTGCQQVEWHVVVVGDNGSDGTHETQAHWAGLFGR